VGDAGEPGDGAQDGRFAAARWSHQRQNLTWRAFNMCVERYWRFLPERDIQALGAFRRTTFSNLALNHDARVLLNWPDWRSRWQ